MKRTKSSRTNRLDTAAKRWIDWESSNVEPVPLEWVAEEVNKSHGTEFRRRWVSQHLEEIQERVEALRNAKG